jgi:hypothetical protein
MTDFDYAISGVNNGYFDQLVWQAVYAWFTLQEPQADPVKVVQQVQKRWRARAVGLRDQGFHRAQGLSFQYLRNCPPVSAKTQTHALPCSCRRICPFCWARQVILPVWERVTGVLFDGDDRRSRPELDLVTFSRIDRYDDLEEAVLNCESQRVTLQIRDVGSVSLRTVAPSAKNDQTVVRRAGLHLITRGERLPATALEGFQVKRFERVNRSDLARLVLPRVCRYPVELLLQQDVGRSLQVLDGTKQFRCCRFTGSLYRRTAVGAD